MQHRTIPPFNMAHTAGPLRWARFADGDQPTPGAPAGGDPAPTPGPDPQQGGQSPDPTPGATAQPGAAPDGSGAPAGDTLPDDPVKLQAMIRDLRRENGRDRTARQQQVAAEAAEKAAADLRAQFAQALGLAKGEAGADEPPTVEALTAQLEEQKAAAAAAAQRLAVYRGSQGLADPDALLDSKAFTDHMADVDVTKPEAVKAAVTEWVNAHPRFATDAQAATASGLTPPSGSGEHNLRTNTLAGAIAAHYGK